MTILLQFDDSATKQRIVANLQKFKPIVWLCYYFYQKTSMLVIFFLTTTALNN